MGINTCLRQIRTALGDHASRPRFIETVPKEGYHFICTVKQSVPLHRKILSFILPAVVGSRLLGEHNNVTSN
jgi:DNA-binding winged helix-turn-helix (wHTH) protein